MANNDSQVDLEMLGSALLGYHRAIARFGQDSARVAEGEDILGALASATECLFWACSLEEQLRKNDPTYEEGTDQYGRSLVQGARWARNQATHQLAFVVSRSGDPVYPQPVPIREAEVVWRRADEMPTAEQERRGQRAAYDQYLSGRSARTTFDSIAGFFASEQNRPGSLLNKMTQG
ncbi:hypothetical protein [Streptomyces sp. NPDC048191]|uniref:hypothetical protein n=1 Tax=Streptomyces sp. NPDC048191 TaxID=3155484 RepID=UPI0033EEA373